MIPIFATLAMMINKVLPTPGQDRQWRGSYNHHPASYRTSPLPLFLNTSHSYYSS